MGRFKNCIVLEHCDALVLVIQGTVKKLFLLALQLWADSQKLKSSTRQAPGAWKETVMHSACDFTEKQANHHQLQQTVLYLQTCLKHQPELRKNYITKFVVNNSITENECAIKHAHSIVLESTYFVQSNFMHTQASTWYLTLLLDTNTSFCESTPLQHTHVGPSAERHLCKGQVHSMFHDIVPFPIPKNGRRSPETNICIINHLSVNREV